MKKKSVLVIDDHDGLRKILGRSLSKNYEVTTRANGVSALAWMHQGNIPDLIVLDMRMPGMSGIDFLSNLRSSGFFRDVAVVIVSADDNPQLVAQCNDLNIRQYIGKPFSPIQLHETIDSILLPNNHTTPSLAE
ncbi:MAG: response regulator [Bacteroidota bacterium]